LGTGGKRHPRGSATDKNNPKVKEGCHTVKKKLAIFPSPWAPAGMSLGTGKSLTFFYNTVKNAKFKKILT
jgi:hypothetical protein